MSIEKNENHSKNKVAIIGAGFSGLTLARYLVLSGIACEIFEASDRSGGMIKTERKDGFLIESAANAILASNEVEKLFSELSIPFEKAGFKSNSRYIFRNKPKLLPFNIFELIFIFFKVIKSLILRNIKPTQQESLSDWAVRVGGEKFKNYLLEPAIGGVYAAKTNQLSAFLVLAGFFYAGFKTQKGKLKGSLSPTNGMQAIIDALVVFLKSKSVKIHYNSKVQVASLKHDFNFIVVASSLKDLKEIVNDESFNLSNDFDKTLRLDISTVTILPDQEKTIKGFGCLFPRTENFKALGVLFNTDIFANRGIKSSETWILPFVSNDSEVVKHAILNDRSRLHTCQTNFEVLKLQTWPNSLPAYNNELLTFLNSSNFKNNKLEFTLPVFEQGARLAYPQNFVYVTGNYLGGIGLAKILDYNLRLSNKIKKDLYESSYS